jgi:hypothetical protein
MISNERRDGMWQGSPEELEENGCLCWIIRGGPLFMPPGSRRIPLTSKMVEMAMMNLLTAKIRHIPLLLTQQAIQHQVVSSRFFKCFP